MYHQCHVWIAAMWDTSVTKHCMSLNKNDSLYLLNKIVRWMTLKTNDLKELNRGLNEGERTEKITQMNWSVINSAPH